MLSKEPIQTTQAEFMLVAERVFGPCGFCYSCLTLEVESTEYGASAFQLGAKKVRFRLAKTTPTKTGQFVTLWKRTAAGPIAPYDAADPVDFFVIYVKNNLRSGIFIFTKEILCRMKVFSTHGCGGKRAMRVYAPWDDALNSQAKKTQAWQKNYFLEISESAVVDLERAKHLFQADAALAISK